MTILIIIASKPTIGSASIPVSAIWRETDASRKPRGRNSACSVPLVARPTKVMMSSVSLPRVIGTLAESDDRFRASEDAGSLRQRLEIEASDQIEQRLVLFAHTVSSTPASRSAHRTAPPANRGRADC
jgi:hypothetical protein